MLRRCLRENCISLHSYDCKYCASEVRRWRKKSWDLCWVVDAFYPLYLNTLASCKRTLLNKVTNFGVKSCCSQSTPSYFSRVGHRWFGSSCTSFGGILGYSSLSMFLVSTTQPKRIGISILVTSYLAAHIHGVSPMRPTLRHDAMCFAV